MLSTRKRPKIGVLRYCKTLREVLFPALGHIQPRANHCYLLNAKQTKIRSEIFGLKLKTFMIQNTVTLGKTFIAISILYFYV